MPRGRTWHSLRTHWNADSVEFAPVSAAEEEAAVRTFVCGNYQLHEDTREKVGRIYLYQLQSAAEGAAASVSASAAASSSAATPAPASASAAPTPQLVERQVLDTKAIFDLKWSPRLVHGKQLLGQADASGALLIYEMQGGAADPSLSLLHTSQVAENASCLSLDWSNRLEDQSDPTIAISQSNSVISLWSLHPADGPVMTQRWTAHEYELWIVHFDTHRANVLYSGADDCKFKVWDLRAGGQQNIRSASFVDESTHGMGVCSIQTHPTRPDLLATGSYDEALRVWDVRNLRQPVVMVEHALGGGVWRVRWNPTAARADSILCANMHNGFAVVDVAFDAAVAGESATDASTAAAASSPSFPSSLTASTAVMYKSHLSLAYGADWCAQPAAWTGGSQERLEQDVIATCSFYDRQLHVWSVDALAEAEADTPPLTSAAAANPPQA